MLQGFKLYSLKITGQTTSTLLFLSIFWVLTISLFVFPSTLAASAEIGKKSPGFTAVDSNGKELRLSQFLGKTVVLEWTNHDCPYVRKHYGTGNMQALQKEAKDQGAIWLSVISSAPGRQGYVTGKQANDLTIKRKAYPTAVLLDTNGIVGQAYGATSTPNMFVISKQGILIYKGAIDNKPSANPADIKPATNYVRAALQSTILGKLVEKAVSRPYGCSIKYGS